MSIETSCDETSAAVVEYRHGRFHVHANVVSSQINIHKKYGGIVPEIAARKQLESIIPVIEETLLSAFSNNTVLPHSKINQTSNFNFQDQIDALAVTTGPGLMIALSVGVETSRTLAAVWNKPIIAVNHLEGHLYSALLPPPRDKSQKIKVKSHDLKFPAIALIVSGGHTELVLVKNYLKHKLLGKTRDDAAGEAYDKVARLLGLGYPGGPIIDRLAQQGNPHAFNFPRGMINSGDYDFSFSGLKTAVLYTLRDLGFKDIKSKIKKQTLLNNLCASFQAAVANILVIKTIRAAEQYKAKTILLGGGVAANSQLRKQLTQETDKLTNSKLLIPSLAYTTDNAAMIAAAAAFHVARKEFTPWQKLKADPGISL